MTLLHKRIHITLLIIASLTVVSAMAQTAEEDSTYNLEEIEVVQQSRGTIKSIGIENMNVISSSELIKAACCNLGESFTTNPSVDVNYSDAATGAKQIKLLGLSGQYVQMLTENIPNYRGLAMPYALGYVPGPWMQSIQVSKGASSVKNGYESITGQINMEFLKPQADEKVEANVFGSTMGHIEGNAMGNIKLNDRWSTNLLLHYQDQLGDNHDENNDGFTDSPKTRQFNLQHRWAYFSPRYIFQASLKGLNENRESGQHGHHMSNPFKIGIETNRYEAFAKNAFFLDEEKNANIALILSGTIHNHDAQYGHKLYDATQDNIYVSLLFEKSFTDVHQLSTGLSLNHDYFDEKYRMTHSEDEPATHSRSHETTPGAYAQYTLTPNEHWQFMAGLRGDYSTKYDWFVTPRAHVKYSPADVFSLRASAGKGYRSPKALAENNHLMASGRTLLIDKLEQEQAWNYGVNATLSIPAGKRDLKLDAEYYYTTFEQQTVIDYDSDPSTLLITNLNGDSYSHTVQLQADYELFTGFNATAAIRYNDVRTTYNGTLLRRPLTNKYKGLLSLSYKPGLGLWQFDASLALNGGGRLPRPYTTEDGTPSWPETYKAFEQLQVQVTRFFRHFDIYAGGENLTGKTQKRPIVAAHAPWSPQFEPTLVYAPVEGRMFYAGVRFHMNK